MLTCLPIQCITMEQHDDGTEHPLGTINDNQIPNTWNDDRVGGKGHMPEPIKALQSVRKDRSGARAK